MKISYIIYLLALLVTVQACKKCKDPQNPECENYDPCFGKSATSAEFKMFLKHTGDTIEEIYDGDKFFPFGLTFEATYPADSFFWKIGAEANFRMGKKIAVEFFPLSAPIPIMLIVKRKPDLDCFLDDDGVDTVVKWVQPVKRNQLPFFGKYLVYFVDNPNDKFTISIDTPSSTPVVSVPTMSNLPEGCTFKELQDIGPRRFSIAAGGYINACGTYGGWATVSKNLEKISAKLRVNSYHPDTLPQYRSFEGQKIQ